MFFVISSPWHNSICISFGFACQAAVVRLTWLPAVFEKDKTRQDNFITFLLNTLVMDLAPQVAKANRGGPGTIN